MLILATIPPFLSGWATLRDDRLGLTGPEQVVASDDGQFLVHYTREGADAPSGGEFAGHPDAVWSIFKGLNDARLQFQDRGYRELVGDTGAGGSSQIDVYIRDIDANGYAYPQAAAFDDGRSCYIEIASALQDPEIIASVTAHELHHCIQYRYTTDAASWIYEATATYEQYRLYDDPVLDLALGVLWVTRLSAPERPLSDRGGRYEYAGFTVLKFMDEFGERDDSRSVQLWETLADEPDWRDAIDLQAQQHWGLGLDQWFVEYSTFNGFACSRDDGAHYDADNVGCSVDTAVALQELPDTGGAFTVSLADRPLTAAYVTLPSGGSDAGFAVGCTEPGDDGEARVRIVSLDAEGAAVDVVDERAVDDERLVASLVRSPPAGSSMLVFANTGRRALELECELERVSAPEIEAGCGCDSPGSGGWWAGLLALLSLRRSGRSAPPPER